MHRRDGVEGLRRIQAFARWKLDQHIDRIGPGELGVEAAACRHRLLLVGHLIGQPITRIERGVEQRQSADDEKADYAVDCWPTHHLVGDQAAPLAQHVDGCVRALDLGGEARLPAHQQHGEQRHEGEDGEERDDGRDEARRPEGPDQV